MLLQAPVETRGFAERIAKTHASLGAIVDVLAEGGVALVHSDIGYLLLADALDRKAVERSLDLRSGRARHPYALVVDPEAADRHVIVGRRARRLMTETWPGTLALRLHPRRSLPSWSAPAGGVTVLCPDALHRRVARALGTPLAAVPADARGSSLAVRPPSRLAATVDLVVDGGVSPAVGTTVIDLTTARPRLRSDGGQFPPRRLQRLVPDLV